MARHLIVRPVCAVAIAGAATIVGLAGCSGTSSGTVAASSPAVTPAPSQHTSAQPTASSQPTAVPVEPLKKSKLFFLTRISRAQLCGLLHGTEPSKILRSSAGPATFANTLGLGVVCTWSQSAGGELYIGLSTLFPWRGAKPIDKFSGDKPTTVDGHPADAGPPNSRISYATVHVATAGLNDPVVEFRAPTLAAALKLAQLVMPRLLAITHAG